MSRITPKLKNRLQNLIPGSVVERETVKKVKLNNPARRIEFEVGDSKQDEFYPGFKTMHWDNECNFSARLVAGQGVVDEHDGKLAFNDGEQIARFYEKDTGDEDGGFEFDVVLPKKPKSNVIRWTIQHKNLDFFYQPELTPEEIADGASRPENVVGSYAVYHKTKKNNQVGGKHYRTGKAFHIYRPYAEDSAGFRVWCDLHIDPDANLMTVTIPQDWLDTADFSNGVIVDPTFGYTTNGGAQIIIADQSNGRSTRQGSVITLAEAGTLDSLHVSLDVASGSETLDVTVFLNARDSIATDSHGEVASVENLSVSVNTTKTFYTFTASGEALAADTYILSVSGDATDLSTEDVRVSYDTTESAVRYSETFFTTSYSSSKEDPWTDTASASTNAISIYATYTASGADYTLSCDAGSYTVGGQNATLAVSRQLDFNNGSYSITGQNATLTVSRAIDLGLGSYSITGNDATLTYNTGDPVCYLLQENGDKILQENNDGILLEVCDVTQFTLNCDAGSYTITGNEVTLVVTRKLAFEAGSYTVTGNNLTLAFNRVINLESGSYSIAGNDVTLVTGRTLSLETGSYSVTGNATTLKVGRVISLNLGTYTLTGNSALLEYSGAPAPSGNIKYFADPTWEVGQLKYWDGSQWQNATLKYWDGSNWQTVTYI